MKNRFRFTILLLACCLLLSQGTMAVHAETEGADEGGSNVTQSSELSMDNTLSSLKIAQAALSPEFSPNQLTYTATVPYEVERVALTAQTSSPEARKVIRGTSDLKVGENVITVTVTAEDGSVREYRITLIRQEMPETTPSESDETPEVSGSDESDSQSDTSEAAPDETSAEETQEVTPEETTPQETLVVPPTTEPNGGMMVETDEEEPRDLNSLLLNPVFLICLVGAIMLISLIVIVVAVIVLREKFLGGKDDDDDEEEDDEDGVEGEEIDEDFEEILEEPSREIFEEPIEELSEKPSQETMESPAVCNAKKSEENAVELAADDDLDDDFEMLLEDDDDFDFLDF